MQAACQVSIRILRKQDHSHRTLFPLPPSSFFSFPLIPNYLIPISLLPALFSLFSNSN
jgi:hypothetical protein